MIALRDRSHSGHVSEHPRPAGHKSLRRVVSEYFVPRGRFKRLIERAELDNEADVYRRNSGHRVFTHADWALHRKPSRYVRHLALIFASKIVRALIAPVLVVALVSALVGLYETLLGDERLPSHWPHVTLELGQGFQFTAFALSLLLVFRTNSAYGRWWEARMMWGSLTNRTRDFVRQVHAFFPAHAGQEREAATLWTVALPYVLKAHLREGCALASELEGTLTPVQLDALLGATQRPCFVLGALTAVVTRAGIDPQLRQRLDTNLTAFEDVVGGCERILRTPIPQSYTRHTSRFLMIWLLLMPFTLWAAYSWATVPLAALFAYLMLGIDEIGVQIEEPFGVLPLGSMCATIERNLRELHYSAGEAQYAAMPWAKPPAGRKSSPSPSLPGTEPTGHPGSRPGTSFGRPCSSDDSTAAGMDGMESAAPLAAAASMPADRPPPPVRHYSLDASVAVAQGGVAAAALAPVWHPNEGVARRTSSGHLPIYVPPAAAPAGSGPVPGATRLAQAAAAAEEEVRPASFPYAAHWRPQHRSWFGGRWVEGGDT